MRGRYSGTPSSQWVMTAKRMSQLSVHFVCDQLRSALIPNTSGVSSARSLSWSALHGNTSLSSDSTILLLIRMTSAPREMSLTLVKEDVSYSLPIASVSNNLGW